MLTAPTAHRSSLGKKVTGAASSSSVLDTDRGRVLVIREIPQDPEQGFGGPLAAVVAIRVVAVLFPGGWCPRAGTKEMLELGKYLCVVEYVGGDPHKSYCEFWLASSR